MALLIRTDGTITPIEPTDPARGFQLEQLYSALGCSMIEVVNLRDGTIFICDEEAKLDENHSMNIKATVHALHRQAIFPNDYIAGPVILCRDDELQ
jgi:uncharacterized protein DUF3846